MARFLLLLRPICHLALLASCVSLAHSATYSKQQNHKSSSSASSSSLPSTSSAVVFEPRGDVSGGGGGYGGSSYGVPSDSYGVGGGGGHQETFKYQIYPSMVS